MKPGFLLLVAIALISLGCNDATSTEAPKPTPVAAPTAAPSVDQFATARANYKKHCEACHGPNAEGGPTEIEGKRVRVPSLKSQSMIRHSDDEMAEAITNGHDEMPAFKEKLSAAEIQDLIRFVRKEFQKQ